MQRKGLVLGAATSLAMLYITHICGIGLRWKTRTPALRPRANVGVAPVAVAAITPVAPVADTAAICSASDAMRQSCAFGVQLKERVRRHMSTASRSLCRIYSRQQQQSKRPISVSLEPVRASGWLQTGKFLGHHAVEQCASSCRISDSVATADIVFFMQHQPKIVSFPSQQLRAVINMEAHTFDQHHLDETDIFANYHAESDIGVTYGGELYPLLSPQDASGDAVHADNSPFHTWCCDKYQCDTLVCALMELSEFLPSISLGVKPAAAPQPAISLGVKPTPQPLMSFFVSNTCHRHGSFLQEMMHRIPADSFGACFTNQNEAAWMATLAPSPTPTKAFAKAWISSQYPFYLAVENTILQDYVTEKFYMAFKLNNTITVYLGAPNAAEYAPAPHSFIHANEFASIPALAEYIHRVAKNDTLFRSYFAWRASPIPTSFRQLVHHTWRDHHHSSLACRACAHVRNKCAIKSPQENNETFFTYPRDTRVTRPAAMERFYYTNTNQPKCTQAAPAIARDTWRSQCGFLSLAQQYRSTTRSSSFT